MVTSKFLSLVSLEILYLLHKISSDKVFHLVYISYKTLGNYSLSSFPEM